MNQQRKIRVAVVFGGRSAEHAGSCVSAGNVLAAMDQAKYEVIPIGITRAGEWVLATGDPARLAITGGKLPSVESLPPSADAPAPPSPPPSPAPARPAPPAAPPPTP